MCHSSDCRSWSLAAALAALLLVFAALSAEAETPTLEPRETWSDVFGGKEVTFHFTLKAKKAWQGRAVWNLLGVNDRVLASGEANAAAAPDKPGEVIVKLSVPEVKEGVVLKARLKVTLVAGDDKKPLATHDRPIWIFADDPFANREVWLRELKIALFDPEKTTAEPLRKLKSVAEQKEPVKRKEAFEEINTVAALAVVKEGLVVVGEGVSFKDYPDLPEALIQAAARGLPVLCLAPSAGSLPVPGAGTKGPQPRAVFWRRQNHITTLDERLDATAWPPEGKMLASTLTLKAEYGAVVADVGRGGDDWPWLEAEFPTKKGRLLVCGFGLFGKAWDAGPAPRYLFARLLGVFTEKSDKSDSQDKETK